MSKSKQKLQEMEQAERLAEKFLKKYPAQMKAMESNSVLSMTNSVQPHHYNTLGKMLYRTEQYIKGKEADGAISTLGAVPLVGLDVVTTAFAYSALPILAAVQDLPDESGVIWYEATKATSTRGNVTAGQTLQDPLSAPDVYPEGYAGANLTATLGNTVATTKAYTFAAAFAQVPVRPRSIHIRFETSAGVFEARDPEGDGNLHGTNLLGTINYATGDVVLQLAIEPAAITPIVGSYSTQIEKDGVPGTIDIELQAKRIDATVYALQAQISMFKQFAMNKRMGIDGKKRLADKLSEAMSQELVNSAISQIVANAQGNTNWDKTPATSVSDYLHYESFRYAMNDAEGVIFNNAGRGGITAILASPKGATLLANMKGFVKGEIPVGGGATLYGVYNNVPVIRAPQISDSGGHGVLYPLYKGNDPYDAALIYGSYMPLVSIDDVPVSDNITLTKNGIATWGGFKTVAPNLITKVTITKS